MAPSTSRAYVATARWERLDAAGRYRALVVATLLLSDLPLVACSWSAAVLHGLDILGPWPTTVHVLASERSRAGRSGLIVRHAIDRGVAEVVRVGDYWATSAARAAVDVARVVTFRNGVVVCDAALRQDERGGTAMAASLAACQGLKGADVARRATAFADGRSGSVGESLSRVVIHELGLPAPDLQRTFVDGLGFVGDTDFWWEQFCTIGEFDGRVKYGRVGTGEDPRDVVWREKRREDRLRGLGTEVARWTWWHIEHPAELQRLLLSAFDRGARRFVSTR
jgi:hypothetical protein